MSHIDLPCPVEDYFAFAELDATKHGRRFTITFPYFDGEKLDRLQWWWSVSCAQQRVLGEDCVTTLRREAAARFRQHIETWLLTNQRRLHGDEPIPRLSVLAQRRSRDEAAVPQSPSDEVVAEAEAWQKRTATG